MINGYYSVKEIKFSEKGTSIREATYMRYLQKSKFSKCLMFSVSYPCICQYLRARGGSETDRGVELFTRT